MINNLSRLLSYAPARNAFQTHFGEITSIQQLRDALALHGEPFFTRYVGIDNHFANWIEGVFKDPEFGALLRKKPSLAGTLETIDARLNFAKHYLTLNEDKEMLYTMMASHELLGGEFSPSHHVFETLSEFNDKHLMRNAPLVPMVELPVIEMPSAELPKEQPLLLAAPEEIREVNVDAFDENRLINNLKDKYPEFKEPVKKSFFARLFNR